MNDSPSLGFTHFIAQSDGISKTLLGILVLMSVTSWIIIGLKGITQLLRRRRSDAFLTSFWNAASLDVVADGLKRNGVHDSFAYLTQQALQANHHHARYGAAKLSDAGTSSEFVARTIKKVLDEETTHLEGGLTMLATIGATAPFVGLFGTVWGVYHALISIGMSGAGTLDKVAGPVGEALVMTGIGLAVAIPAVMAYNWLNRANRVVLSKLDSFAHDLHTFVCMGQPLTAPATSVARVVTTAHSNAA